MEQITSSFILSLIGSFIGIALTINAYFLRTLIVTLNNLKNFAIAHEARTTTEIKHTEKAIEKLEGNIRDIYKRLNQIERR